MMLVNSNNFQKEILKSKKPVLLAYINLFFNHDNQTEIVFHVQNFYKNTLKVCVVDEEDPAIIDILGIIGSPTYFFFFQGREIKRALGVKDPTTLFLFFSTTLQGIGFNECRNESRIAVRKEMLT